MLLLTPMGDGREKDARESKRNAKVFYSDDRPGSLHFGIQSSDDCLSCFFCAQKEGVEMGMEGGKFKDCR